MKHHYAIDMVFIDKEARTVIVLDTPDQVVQWTRTNAGKLDEPCLTLTAYPVTLH